MIEIEWKPKINHDRVFTLLPPLPNAETCHCIQNQPLMIKHYRNTIQTLCENDKIPYLVVYVPWMNPLNFEDIERFEKLYGKEVRIIPRLELLYTSLEYSATLTHECVYMLRDPNEWMNSSIPLEWFFDVAIQEQLYPYYDDVGYGLVKELRKFIKIQSGSSVIYEKCMMSLSFKKLLETLLKKCLSVENIKPPPEKEKDDLGDFAIEAEGSLAESPNARSPNAQSPTDSSADDSTESTDNDELQDSDWILVLGSMEETESSHIYATLSKLLKRDRLKAVYNCGFSLSDALFYDENGTRLYPNVGYHTYSTNTLESSQLTRMLISFQRAVCSFYTSSSVFWMGSFELKDPDEKRKWPRGFYTPSAWCSLHPNEIYGATHANTDWLIYEPVGALHSIA
jgi:hypothetical protein